MAASKVWIDLGKGAKYYRNRRALGVRGCALLHSTPGVPCRTGSPHPLETPSQGYRQIQRKTLDLYPPREDYFSPNTMSWNEFLSFYSQSVCNSSKLEPCSAPATDALHHTALRGFAGTTQTCLCLGQVCREGAAVPLLREWNFSQPSSQLLLSLSRLVFPPLQKDCFSKNPALYWINSSKS